MLKWTVCENSHITAHWAQIHTHILVCRDIRARLTNLIKVIQGADCWVRIRSHWSSCSLFLTMFAAPESALLQPQPATQQPCFLLQAVPQTLFILYTRSLHGQVTGYLYCRLQCLILDVAGLSQDMWSRHHLLPCSSPTYLNSIYNLKNSIFVCLHILCIQVCSKVKMCKYSKVTQLCDGATFSP